MVPLLELLVPFVLTPVLKTVVPLRFGPRTTALKVPVVWKKVPFPKGFPFLLEAPAWVFGEHASKAINSKKDRTKFLGDIIKIILPPTLCCQPDLPGIPDPIYPLGLPGRCFASATVSRNGLYAI